MSALQINVTGLDEMIASMRTASKRAVAATVPALESIMNEAFDATQAAVPVVTGNLKASGKVEHELAGDIWTGQISYGGFGIDREVDYADDVIVVYNEDFMAPIDNYLGPLFEAFAVGLDGL